MARPSISITVLNYNYGRYVGEALQSAVGQEPGGYSLAEVVVIDDGSTDRSHEVYQRFPEARVVRKAHEGFGATLTRAVEEASGDWLALLDADDAFMPHKLRTLTPSMADPAVLLIGHAEHVIDAKGRLFAEGTHPGGSTSTLVVCTGAARDLLPVTNELFFHVLADLGRGICLPEPLTRYRVHEASMTDRRTPGVFADYMAGVCADVATRLSKLGERPPAWATADQLADLAARYLHRAAGQRNRARCQRERGRLGDPREGTCA